MARVPQSPIVPDTPSNIFPIESTEVYNLKQSNKSLHRKWCGETKTAIPLSPALSDISLSNP